MKRFLTVVAAAVMSAGSLRAAAPVGEGLKVEWTEQPLAVQAEKPRFSWRLAAPKKGEEAAAQTGYEILVATSPAMLEAGKADLWDSGLVQSGETLQVVYGGKALTSGERAYWKVKLTGQNGETWTSEPETFTMGLLKAEDWKGKWIGFPGDDADKGMRPAPFFRKEFAVGKTVNRARVYVCGVGQYELSINGRKVGDAVVTPAWTDYKKTCVYDTYDVTDLVKQGGNAAGLVLGNGMFNVLRLPGRYTKFTGSFGTPRAIVQLEVEHTDGTKTVVVSDGTWKASRGPITFDHPYGGEDYNAELEMPGWNVAGFKDATWPAAAEVPSPGGELAAGIGGGLPAIKVDREYPFLRIMEPRKNVWVYDMGQNASGWPRLKVRGPRGTVVKMTPGELLYKDGRVAPVVDTKRGVNTYSYTLKGVGDEEWSPKFSAYGFRYVMVEGARPPLGTATSDTQTGVGREPMTMPAEGPSTQAEIIELATQFTHAELPVAGFFESSDGTLNRIHKLITMAVLSNAQSVLTDCPQREKLGWLEQSHLMADSIAMNFDIGALYPKMARDMRDAQLENGLVPNIAPEYVQFKGDFRDSPEWGAAAVIDPWVTWNYYQDKRTLEEQYPTMKRYIAYLGTKATNNLLDHGLGDWFDAPPANHGAAKLTTRGLTASAIYYRDLVVMKHAAELLRKGDDAKAYGEAAEQVRTAFNAKYFDPEKATYEKGSQTANGMPLALGLVPEEKRAAVLANLVKSIEGNGYMVTSGDVGYTYVVQALTEAGKADVMYGMMTQDAGPGYVYQLEHGATTLTESWALGTTSQNHLMIGHGETWLYQGLAGIMQDTDDGMGQVGWKKIVIRPQVPKALKADETGKTWVEGRYQSPRGLVVSRWERDGDKVTLKVTVPTGCEAKVVVPGGEVKQVGGGTYVFEGKI